MKTYFKQIDGGALEHSERVQEVFSEVAEALRKMCRPQKGIC